jgi:HSP20 family protein
MTELVRFDPFREMSPFREAMDRLLERDFFRPFNGWSFLEGNIHTLALDMYETDDNLVVETSLSGMKPEEVDISIVGNILTIKGETKHEEEKEEKGKYYCRERRFGAFHRALTLPAEVDPDKVEALFENGVLTLTMPKVEAAKPKRITIKKK